MDKNQPVQCEFCQDYFSTDKISSHKERHTKRLSELIRVPNIFPNKIIRGNISAYDNIKEYYVSENTGTCD
jgi:hypothetical protein